MSPSCLTCTKTIEFDESSIPIGITNETAQNAITKHFWFNEDECMDAVLCQRCWQKIDEFHQFYCEIERIHTREVKYPIQVLEIKQEQDQADIKNEIEEADVEAIEDSSGSNEQSAKEEESEEDSDSDYEANTRRKTTRKKPTSIDKDELAKVDNYATKHVSLECSFCSEKHPTFDALQRHSKKVHRKPTTVFCCKKKFCQRCRFYEHIQYHLNPNQFQCDKCEKRCPSSEALKSHMDIKHATEKSFPCEICPKKFALKSLVIAHRKRCHATEDSNSAGAQHGTDDEDMSEGADSDGGSQERDTQKTKRDEEFIAANISLECHVCNQKNSTYQDFLKHSQAEHGVHAAVYCCGLKFTRKPRLIDHIHFHRDPSQFRCDVCGKQFKHSEALSNHKGMKHAQEEAKIFQCSMCPKAYSQQKFLHVHEKYHRKMNEKNFRCESCDRYFAFESMLKQHERLVHTKECHFVCHICARGFQALSSYSSHLASHDEEAKKKDKPPEERIQCKVCNTWVNKQNYRKHVLLHSGTQTCDICGQQCKSVMSLRYHKAQHRRGECNCSVCGKSFKRMISLKEHMASHTGEVLYSCDFCDRTFNSNANRASHRKRMHPKEWYEDKMRKNPNMLKEQQDGEGQTVDSLGLAERAFSDG